jgi:MFS transporter, DHA3 family, macrolide efflux protein
VTDEPASSSAAGVSTTSFRGLLRNRTYGLFLVGNVAGWGGLAIADVMFLFLVYSETGSALAVAYVGLVEALPPIAVGLPAGVLADRYDRRRVLAVTSLLQAGVLGVVLAYLWRFGFHLVVILLLVFVLETVTVLFRPASNALLPDLVESRSLDDANGILQASTSVAASVGAAAAALLLVVAGTLSTVLLDTLILLLGGLLFAAIVAWSRRNAPDGSGAEPNLGRELREAIAYLREHPPLVQLTVVAVASGFFVEMFSPFLVVYTVKVLAEPGGTFGYLLAGFSAGFFLGSLVVGRIGILAQYGRFYAVGLILSGILLALLVVVPNFGIALGALTGIGLLLGLIVTGFTILVQRVVPPDLLGRYLGLDETLTWAIAPLGILTGGVVAQMAGIRVAFGIAVIGLIATGALGLGLRGMRSIGIEGPAPTTIVPPGVLGEEFVPLAGAGHRLPEPGAELPPIPEQVGP